MGYSNVDPAHGAEHGCAGDNHPRDAFRSRRLRGRQAVLRLLGPLGSRRQRALAKLCREWADKEKVELTMDFITSQGDKLALTATAEAQARSGHNVLQMSDWYVAAKVDNLEPVDELVASLIKEHGKLLLGSEYIGRQKGRWIAVPTGVQTTGQTPCARIDHFKQCVGLDVARTYPAGAPPDEALADAWTWDGFLAAAEKCAKAGTRSVCRSALGATRSTG